jgi:hypothetical protein
MIRTAVISEDGVYRYVLYREWDVQLPTILFIMLNPSTADGDSDDPTIRRVINFAKGPTSFEYPIHRINKLLKLNV